MIRLYREETSTEADAIEAEFRELVLGYDKMIVESSQAREMFAGRPLPVITNNERVVSGDEIRPFMKELEKLMQDWQLFQGDYCYLGEDGDC